jgi:WD40 repeat protein
MLATVSSQARYLRSSLLLTHPGYALRQLCLQAAELGEDRLASDLRARLLSQPDPGLIPIWTTRRTSRALLAELGRHDRPVTAVAVLPDGRVVSGGKDRRVLIWNATTQRQVAQLGCSVIGLATVQASSSEAFLVVAREGQGFSLWSTTRGDNEPF